VAATLKALDHWFWNAAVGPWMRCFCADYRDLSLPQDHEYITHSREKMLGRKLEEIQAGRERLAGISAALEPLRSTLAQHPWLGGSARTMPIIASWAASCSPRRYARRRCWPKTIRCATGSTAASISTADWAAIPACSRCSA
jgi:hypothetical protein